ncbi:hypothetical protein JCM3765_003478 [Sporobolomyces pararoseus]
MSLELPDVSSLSLDSPSSIVPPSLPPPIRYFDLLPPELVRQIVEQTPSTTKVGSEGRSTLRALCLTSHQLRSIAQPLLLRDIIIENDEDVDELEDLVRNNPLENLKLVRNFVVNIYRNPVDDAGWEAVETLLSAAEMLETFSSRGYPEWLPLLGSRLRKLTLNQVDVPDSTVHFPSLLRLLLSRCNFGPNLPFVCPSLDYLGVNRCTFKEATDGGELGGGGVPLLDVPSLRHLNYSSATRAPISSSERLLLGRIVPTLQTAHLEFIDLHLRPESLLSSPSICRIVHAEVGQLNNFGRNFPLVEYLHLYSYSVRPRRYDVLSSSRDIEIGSALAQWTNLVDGSKKLKSLILEGFANVRYPAISTEVSRLLDICDRRDIIVFFDRSD